MSNATVDEIQAIISHHIADPAFDFQTDAIDAAAEAIAARVARATDEIERLIGEGYEITISELGNGYASVEVTKWPRGVVSRGLRPTLADAMMDAYAGTPEAQATAATLLKEALEE